MKERTVTMGNGETVNFYMTDDGRHVCPVCGLIFPVGCEPNPPWDDNGNPSYDSCPCCHTEYGYHDGMSDESPIGANAVMWEELRRKWVAGYDKATWKRMLRTGGPSKDDVRKPDAATLEQLRNIGLNPEDYKPK